MTKRWLSLVLVLTMLATLFTGASAAGTSRGVNDPRLTFVPVFGNSVLDLTNNKTTTRNITVGQFYADGVALSSNLQLNTLGLKLVLRNSDMTPVNNGTEDWTYNVTVNSIGAVNVTGIKYEEFESTILALGKAGGKMTLDITASGAYDALNANGVFNMGTLNAINNKEIDAGSWQIVTPISGVSVTASSTSPSTDVNIGTGNTTISMYGKGLGATFSSVVTPSNAAVDSYEWTMRSGDDKVVAFDGRTDQSSVGITSVGTGVAMITLTVKNATQTMVARSWTVQVLDYWDPNFSIAPLVQGAGNNNTGSSDTDAIGIAEGTRIQLVANTGTRDTGSVFNWTHSKTADAVTVNNGAVELIRGKNQVGDTFRVTATNSSNSSRPQKHIWFTVVAESSISHAKPSFIIGNNVVGNSTQVSNSGETLTISGTQSNARYIYVATSTTLTDAQALAALQGSGVRSYTGPITLTNRETANYYAMAVGNADASKVASLELTVKVAPVGFSVSNAHLTEIKGNNTLTFAGSMVNASEAYYDQVLWEISTPNGGEAVVNGVTVDNANAATIVAKSISVKVTQAVSGGTVVVVATPAKAQSDKYSSLAQTITLAMAEIQTLRLSGPSPIAVRVGERIVLGDVTVPADASNQVINYSTNTTNTTTAGEIEIESSATPTTIVGKKAGQVNVVLTQGSLTHTIVVNVQQEGTKTTDPVISPAGKKFEDGNGEISISCSTVDAQIFYTIDGTTPIASATGSSILYSGPFTLPVNQVTTVQVIAVDTNKAPSNIVSAVFDTTVTAKSIRLDGDRRIEGSGDVNASAASANAGVGLVTATLTSSDPAAVNAPKNSSITWTVAPEGIVKVVPQSVNAGSEYNQQALVVGLKPGKATITAKTPDVAASATFEVEVTEVRPVAIRVVDGNAISSEGSTPLDRHLPLTSIFVDANNNEMKNVTNKAVAWRSTNQSVAIVDADGMVTPVSMGTTEIYVTSVALSSGNVPVSHTFKLTVQAASNIIDAPRITNNVSTTTYNLEKEATITITNLTIGATIYYTLDGTTPTTSSPVYTGPFKLHKDSTINVLVVKGTAQAKAGPVRYTFDIKASEVKITNAPTQMVVGDTIKLNAVLSPEFVSDSNKTLTWNATPTTIVKVDANGDVTAIGPGRVTIGVTAIGGKTDTVIINVLPLEVEAITVMPNSIDITIGEARLVSASIRPAKASDKALTWDSSNRAVATVATVNGQMTVTGISAGEATITATSNNGKSGSILVTVDPDPEVLPHEPVGTPVFVPAADRTIKVIEGESLVKVLGKLEPATGETWEQIRAYYAVSVTSTQLQTFGAFINVERDGTLTLYIPNAEVGLTSFDFTWRLTMKAGRNGLGTLNGLNRTVTGNAVTVVPKPQSIVLDAPALDDVIITEASNMATRIMGRITNYSEFVNAGIALDVVTDVQFKGKVPAQDRAAIRGFSTEIAANGDIVLTVKDAPMGMFEVVVTINADGCKLVSTKPVKVTVNVGEEYLTDKEAVDLAKVIIEALTIELTAEQAATEQSAKEAIAKAINDAIGASLITVTADDITLEGFGEGDSFTFTVTLKRGDEANVAMGTVSVKTEEPTDPEQPEQPVDPEQPATPTTIKVSVNAASGMWPNGTGNNLARADRTVQFVLEGATATRWTSSKPKVISINATTGVATLRKLGAKVTITATYQDENGATGTVTMTNVAVRKVATAMRFQVRSGSKWVNVPAAGLNIREGVTRRLRLVTRTPSSGKKYGTTFATVDTSVIRLAVNGYKINSITAIGVGSDVVTATTFNGVSASMNVNVRSKDAPGGDDVLEFEELEDLLEDAFEDELDDDFEIEEAIEETIEEVVEEVIEISEVVEIED